MGSDDHGDVMISDAEPHWHTGGGDDVMMTGTLFSTAAAGY